MTTAEVVDRLTNADVPCAPVLGLDELHQHEQIVASGSIDTFEHPVMGPVRQPLPAPRFNGKRTPAGFPAHALSADADAVLSEAGYRAEDIARLRETGVVTPRRSAGR
jgi:crotonobetainyl-CoA:carnitine CoA-transferase CaiB-like acyl-CoA transferase